MPKGPQWIHEIKWDGYRAPPIRLWGQACRACIRGEGAAKQEGPNYGGALDRAVWLSTSSDVHPARTAGNMPSCEWTWARDLKLTSVAELQEWEAWVKGALGLWTLGAPWVLGFANVVTAMWTRVGVGLVVAILAAIELWLIHSGPPAKTA